VSITGAAGTGKTVALMHRAVHLARGLADPRARVLVTTFTTNLSVTIKHYLQRLAPDVTERIEVTNLHALARTICSRSGWKGRIAEDDDLAQIWEEVWRDPALGALPMSKDDMTKIPLSRAGIDVRGRARRLKINYRTSEQIRKFAQGLLQGLEIDDLDGGTVTTVGDHSVFKGPPPLIERCQDGTAEAQAIVAWVRRLMDRYGLATHEICITPYKPAIRTALTEADVATFELKPREADPGADEAGVRLGTMPRIKGLEFRAVALACADPSDPIHAMQAAEMRDRCERYVAATRAREHRLVTVLTEGKTFDPL
jgi:superfamily I DNA/RNA helicase